MDTKVLAFIFSIFSLCIFSYAAPGHGGYLISNWISNRPESSASELNNYKKDDLASGHYLSRPGFEISCTPIFIKKFSKDKIIVTNHCSDGFISSFLLNNSLEFEAKYLFNGES